MANYFNTLSLRDKLTQLGKCRFMDRNEFTDGCDLLKGWNIVIIGCGAQGLNQGVALLAAGGPLCRSRVVDAFDAPAACPSCGFGFPRPPPAAAPSSRVVYASA